MRNFEQPWSCSVIKQARIVRNRICTCTSFGQYRSGVRVAFPKGEHVVQELAPGERRQYVDDVSRFEGCRAVS